MANDKNAHSQTTKLVWKGDGPDEWSIEFNATPILHGWFPKAGTYSMKVSPLAKVRAASQW